MMPVWLVLPSQTRETYTGTRAGMFAHVKYQKLPGGVDADSTLVTASAMQAALVRDSEATANACKSTVPFAPWVSPGPESSRPRAVSSPAPTALEALLRALA
jgi:hypothetical protein